MRRRLLAVGTLFALGLGLGACQLPTGRTVPATGYAGVGGTGLYGVGTTAACTVAVSGQLVYGGTCAQAYRVAKAAGGTVVPT